MTYQQQRQSVLSDPAASFWLKGCMLSAEVRDPVDVLNDLEVLIEIARVRADEVFGGAAAGRAA